MRIRFSVLLVDTVVPLLAVSVIKVQKKEASYVSHGCAKVVDNLATNVNPDREKDDLSELFICHDQSSKSTERGKQDEMKLVVSQSKVPTLTSPVIEEVANVRSLAPMVALV